MNLRDITFYREIRTNYNTKGLNELKLFENFTLQTIECLVRFLLELNPYVKIRLKSSFTHYSAIVAYVEKKNSLSSSF